MTLASSKRKSRHHDQDSSKVCCRQTASIHSKCSMHQSRQDSTLRWLALSAVLTPSNAFTHFFKKANKRKDPNKTRPKTHNPLTKPHLRATQDKPTRPPHNPTFFLCHRNVGTQQSAWGPCSSLRVLLSVNSSLYSHTEYIPYKPRVTNQS